MSLSYNSLPLCAIHVIFFSFYCQQFFVMTKLPFFNLCYVQSSLRALSWMSYGARIREGRGGGGGWGLRGIGGSSPRSSILGGDLGPFHGEQRRIREGTTLSVDSLFEERWRLIRHDQWVVPAEVVDHIASRTSPCFCSPSTAHLRTVAPRPPQELNLNWTWQDEEEEGKGTFVFSRK